jgi:hypothetical protein
MLERVFASNFRWLASSDFPRFMFTPVESWSVAALGFRVCLSRFEIIRVMKYVKIVYN